MQTFSAAVLQMEVYNLFYCLSCFDEPKRKERVLKIAQPQEIAMPRLLPRMLYTGIVAAHLISYMPHIAQILHESSLGWQTLL